MEKGAIIFSVSGKREASGQIENGIIRNVTTFADGAAVGKVTVVIIAVKEPKMFPLRFR